jgi:hypothetical protein
MATHAEKLATSLRILTNLSKEPNRTFFRSNEFTRTHRERLIQSGFLIEIIHGWLMINDPTKRVGESTLWYSNFWRFLSAFLENRFGNSYCLSAEASLSLHTASPKIPRQVTVITEKSSGQTIDLPHCTSLFLYQDIKNQPFKRDIKNGLQIMSLPEAICRLSKTFYAEHQVEAEIGLSLIRDASQLLYFLLKYGKSTTAGYLVGAYRHMNKNDMAQKILDGMIAGGHKIVIENPFKTQTISFLVRPLSPHANRIQVMWFHYRQPILDRYPEAPGLPINPEKYLTEVEEHYVNDAYNSLSIEGYQVTPGLIERIQNGEWNPNENSHDVHQRDALAAKGYRLAFESVRSSIQHVLEGKNPGLIVREDLSKWYTALFSPSVQAGILQEYHLAGYRSHQVFIQTSRHIPFPQTAILDSMDMLFDLVTQEDHPAVRAILGHFFFVHIHPYGDGNGRIGRFFMNVMFASGGYPWTIIPVSRRSEYMNALEKASCEDNIIEFTEFIRSLG